MSFGKARKKSDHIIREAILSLDKNLKIFNYEKHSDIKDRQIFTFQRFQYMQ